MTLVYTSVNHIQNQLNHSKIELECNKIEIEAIEDYLKTHHRCWRLFNAHHEYIPEYGIINILNEQKYMISNMNENIKKLENNKATVLEMNNIIPTQFYVKKKRSIRPYKK
jgi:hypothetical protein